MRDIELNSPVLRLKDFPADTDKIMILYDNRGWAIRCYSDKAKYGTNNKLTTMIPDERLGDSGSDITLVPREQLKQSESKEAHGDNCRCIKINQ